MKLAMAFDGAMLAARIAVKHACGNAIVTCIEAMGYRVVPLYFVDAFREVLERDDEKRAALSVGKEPK